jgi:hypothetical protein
LRVAPGLGPHDRRSTTVLPARVDEARGAPSRGPTRSTRWRGETLWRATPDQLRRLLSTVEARFGVVARLADAERRFGAARTGRSLAVRPQTIAAGTLGCAATSLILFGASQTTSPYSFKALPYAWYFGVPRSTLVLGSVLNTSRTPAALGVLSVLGGMVLVIGAWLWLLSIKLHGRVSWLQLMTICAAWVIPLLIVAPLFSRDVYSYVAQGEMTSHHISPYPYGPAVLGPGNEFTLLTDPLWRQSPSPYGPLFLRLAGSIVSITGHAELLSVELLRVLALLGVALAGVGVALIARRFGRDPILAVLLVALNPLVLLHLVAGAHNDSLMMGLLVLGIAAALYERPFIGITLCALATAVKAPAALGIVFIGWSCVGRGTNRRHRQLRGLIAAIALGTAITEGLGTLTGLGWGWIKGLSNPGAVRMWLDPPTGLGMFLGKLLNLVDLSGLDNFATAAMRLVGILLASAIILRLLKGVDHYGLVQSVGLSLLAVAILGPAVQPWYLTWAAILLAPVVTRRALASLAVGSAVACFLGLPLGALLIGEFEATNAIVQIAVVLSVLGLCFLVVAKVRGLAPRPRLHPSPAATGAPRRNAEVQTVDS